jgi:hypothetical protein
MRVMAFQYVPPLSSCSSITRVRASRSVLRARLRQLRREHAEVVANLGDDLRLPVVGRGNQVAVRGLGLVRERRVAFTTFAQVYARTRLKNAVRVQRQAKYEAQRNTLPLGFRPTRCFARSTSIAPSRTRSRHDVGGNS